MISLNENAAPVLQHRDGSGEQTTMPGIRASGHESTKSRGASQVEALLMRGIGNTHQTAAEQRRWELIPSLQKVACRFPADVEEGQREARLSLLSRSAGTRSIVKAAKATALWLRQGGDDGKE